MINQKNNKNQISFGYPWDSYINELTDYYNHDKERFLSYMNKNKKKISEMGLKNIHYDVLQQSNNKNINFYNNVNDVDVDDGDDNYYNNQQFDKVNEQNIKSNNLDYEDDNYYNNQQFDKVNEQNIKSNNLDLDDEDDLDDDDDLDDVNDVNDIDYREYYERYDVDERDDVDDVDNVYDIDQRDEVDVDEVDVDEVDNVYDVYDVDGGDIVSDKTNNNINLLTRNVYNRNNIDNNKRYNYINDDDVYKKNSKKTNNKINNIIQNYSKSKTI
jgi:hypothetical protein